MQILSIDDDIAIRDAIREVLLLAGYSVRSAANGKDALDLLNAMKTAGKSMPQLILLDLMMPVMDGWKFSEAMLHDSELSTIPIVVVSAFTKADDLATQANIIGVIRKPLSIEQLLNTVKEVCGSPCTVANEMKIS